MNEKLNYFKGNKVRKGGLSEETLDPTPPTLKLKTTVVEANSFVNGAVMWQSPKRLLQRNKRSTIILTVSR